MWTQAAINFSFIAHIAVIFYAGLCGCIGYGSEILAYAVTSFIVGWPSFLMASCTILTVPRQHGSRTVCALTPVFAMAFWGIWILKSTPFVMDANGEDCEKPRFSVVCVLCGIHFLEMAGFTAVFAFCIPMTSLPTRSIEDDDLQTV